MDQDLRSRIKAAAQERGLDPEIAVSFAKAESSLDPNAKAKTSSARGLFQVIDRTWKEYGGGDKKDINEQIRVGTDVIASNQASFKRKFNREPSAAELYAYHVLGPTGAPQLLRADPATPMEQIVSREAIKANPMWKGKTAGDVLGTYEKKVGGSQQTRVATQQPKPGMRPTNYSFEPLTQLDIENLGPGYQAGLAAMALADTQDNDEDNIAERAQEAREDAENSMLADEGSRNIANLEFSYASPFPQEAPVQMAKGGEARKMMDAVYRADGSPEYGEISMGDFSDPNAGRDIMKNIKMPTKEDVKYLSRIPKEGASNAESFIRGSLAAIPGTAGDIEAAFRSNPKNQVLPTTEKILKSVPRITPANERSAGFEDVGTYDMGLATAPLARGAGKVIAAGAKVAAPIAAEMALKAAPAAQPMNIVTPSGRVFISNMKIGEEPLSKLDLALNTIKTHASIDPEKEASVIKFMDTKFRDYVKNRAGTINDDLREALLEGRIKIPKDTPLEEGYPQALIDAARKGDITALKQLEFKLNRDIGVESKQISKLGERGNTFAEEAAAREENVRSILEQMKNNPNVIPDGMLLRLIGKDITTMPTKQAAEKVAEMKEKLQKNPTLFNTIFEEKLLRLIRSTDLDVVSPSSVKDYPDSHLSLTSAPSKQEGIMALTQNAPITDVDSYPTFFGMNVRDVAEAAQHIPEKDLERMSVPEVVNYALQHITKTEEIGSFARKAESLASAGKEVPPKISTFGTKEIMPADKDGFMWREIINPDAVKVQAAIMKNSIGSYATPGTYGALKKGRPALTSGEVRIFGLYDSKNQLLANAEYVTSKAKDEAIANTIAQIKGNGPRTGGLADTINYPNQVETLINYLNPRQIPNGIKKMLDDNGIFFTK